MILRFLSSTILYNIQHIVFRFLSIKLHILFIPHSKRWKVGNFLMIIKWYNSVKHKYYLIQPLIIETNLFVYLSVCLFFCLFACLFACLFVCLFVCRFQSVRLSLRLSARLSVFPSVYSSVCSFNYLSVCLNIEIAAIIAARDTEFGI